MQGDSILHSHARAGTKRKVHGTQRIAEQHDVATSPVPVADNISAEPERPITENLIAAELAAQHIAAVPAPLVFAHAIETRAPPCPRVDFDQKGAQRGAVLVAVGNEHAVLGVLEDERDGMKELAGAVQANLFRRVSKLGWKCSAN